ncbi:MAG TPA: hypothetical protein VFI31_26185 [Pirellulales bacterium]|nr:hypothetical protein [Pirellulales bacterium]
MDQATLVEKHIDDGEKLLASLRSSGFDVTAAAWLKASEDGQWFFYIASAQVDRVGLAAAYRTVYLTIQQTQDLWVDPFEIKLIGPNNPIAKDILDILRRYPARIPTRYRGPRLGSIHIDEAYIYAATTP